MNADRDKCRYRGTAVTPSVPFTPVGLSSRGWRLSYRVAAQRLPRQHTKKSDIADASDRQSRCRAVTSPKTTTRRDITSIRMRASGTNYNAFIPTKCGTRRSPTTVLQPRRGGQGPFPRRRGSPRNGSRNDHHLNENQHRAERSRPRSALNARVAAGDRPSMAARARTLVTKTGVVIAVTAEEPTRHNASARREPNSAEPAALRVFTIGHSTREFDEVLAMLRSNSVTELVDVRSFPSSRKFPQWNQEAVKQALPADIGYRWIQDLGGRRHTPAGVASPNGAWRVKAFRDYADYMATAGFASGLAELLQVAGETVPAIMCSEAVPWRCHRRLITDALIVAGVEVFDIMSLSSTRRASMDDFAVVHAGKITYPTSGEA